MRVASRVTAKLKKNQEEDPSYVISFIIETKNVAQRHHAMWRHL